jgi:long-chain-alcohol oxidase
VDGQGKPRIHYTLADQDKDSMMQGMQLGLRCLAAAGADLLMTTAELPGNSFSPAARPEADAAPPAAEAHAAPAAGAAPPPGTATQQVAEPPGPPAADPALQEYLQRVQAAGIPHLSMGLFSAHQLGTAALGADPASSVLDPAGECWDVAGLYCCDGSALPTSTGERRGLRCSARRPAAPVHASGWRTYPAHGLGVGTTDGSSTLGS